MLRALSISRDLVDSKDTSNIERLLSELETNPTLVRQVQGSFLFEFTDYGETPILLVPGAKEYLKELFHRIPHLWYYLVPNPMAGNLLLFFGSQSPEEQITVAGDQTTVGVNDDLVAVLAASLSFTTLFAKRMADDYRKIIARIVEPLDETVRNRLVVLMDDVASLNVR